MEGFFQREREREFSTPDQSTMIGGGVYILDRAGDGESNMRGRMQRRWRGIKALISYRPIFGGGGGRNLFFTSSRRLESSLPLHDPGIIRKWIPAALEVQGGPAPHGQRGHGPIDWRKLIVCETLSLRNPLDEKSGLGIYFRGQTWLGRQRKKKKGG